jgi:hypothetical protein
VAASVAANVAASVAASVTMATVGQSAILITTAKSASRTAI